MVSIESSLETRVSTVAPENTQNILLQKLEELLIQRIECHRIIFAVVENHSFDLYFRISVSTYTQKAGKSTPTNTELRRRKSTIHTLF